jgi:hypothetical protein
MAFLLDRLTDAVAAGIPQLEAAGPSAAVGAGATAAAPQQLAPEASAPLPQPLASWLSGRVQVRLLAKLRLAGVSMGGAAIRRRLDAGLSARLASCLKHRLPRLSIAALVPFMF